MCKTICEWYQRIFAEFHIKSIVIPTNQKPVPHYALIVEEDQGCYIIDPLKDLFANQLGIKPDFFGVFPFSFQDRKKNSLI